MRLDVATCLPQEAETVTLVRAVVSNTLALFGVTQDCIDDIRVALSEACTNVIEHAEASDEYEVRIEIDGQQCTLSVRNTGNGFDVAALAGATPDGLSPRGRGVAIMRALMDQVQFSSDPEAGTVVRLIKVLTADEHAPLSRLHGRPGSVAPPM